MYRVVISVINVYKGWFAIFGDGALMRVVVGIVVLD